MLVAMFVPLLCRLGLHAWRAHTERIKLLGEGRVATVPRDLSRCQRCGLVRR
jgi:hypothetical protein